MIEIYKFGGASVKDAEGVINLLRVIKQRTPERLGIVVSAMGKTTNALEAILDAYHQRDLGRMKQLIDQFASFHDQLMEELIQHPSVPSAAKEALSQRETRKKITHLIHELVTVLDQENQEINQLYDQVVSYGELLSTTIVGDFLASSGLACAWLDARELIYTNDKYRDAKVDWITTEQQINERCRAKCFITQGFIAATDHNKTTTLGREGSDYTAAILAHCLEAKCVTIWKDVQGVLNADPRVFNETQLLHNIPYDEAIELAFYGASVIHPKTIQPLQKKQIPLYVRSFLDPKGAGTCVGQGKQIDPLVPCYIVRDRMALLRIASKDFSFIGEENISEIFNELNRAKMQVGLMQNSAISFMLCIEDKYHQMGPLLTALQSRFEVSATSPVTMYTIRHLKEGQWPQSINEDQVLLRQRTQDTLQIVIDQSQP